VECPLCGDLCHCPTEARTANRDVQAPISLSEVVADESQSRVGTLPDCVAWRDQVAERLSRYRERRKPRAPRYPSLLLRFDAQPSSRDSETAASCGSQSASEPVLPSVSRDAVALDESSTDQGQAISQPQSEGCARVARMSSSGAASEPSRRAQRGEQSGLHSHASHGTQPGGKLIEFPRSWAAPPAPLDELAEPVADRPRILEAAEILPPAPALGGITIEAVERNELEKRPGIDIPLQSAPLGRRILAAAADGLIIAAASALFGFVFWKVTGVQPPLYQFVGLAAGVTCSSWAIYQYLLIVYSASTPGLRLAGLELDRFDGSRPCRRIRRWRVLASFLSAASLGMGYAWVFLDEDSLCWHDRITHTYLAPKNVGASEHAT